MPELPEVETIRRGVERYIIGLQVVGVKVTAPKILKPPVVDPDELAEKMVSATFVDARRRGKHLIFGLDNGYALYAHLNMRGQIVVSPHFDEPNRKYLCVAIRYNSGVELRYHDIWTWGELRLLQDSQEEINKFVPALAAMGPEPLSELFDGHVLKERARSRFGSPIKTALLDQSVLAGVGNIYADESLFRSGINPLRKATTLTDQEWAELAKQVVEVVSCAVEDGGTMSDNYVDVNGAAGRYRPKVYGRAKELCVRCEAPLAGSRLGGRSTVFCPKCQK